jgi:hypothetical protein
MKTLAEFTKTTLIGGVLIILPIYVAVLLLAKAVKGLLALLTPVAEQLPAGVQFRQIAAILLLVTVCFVVGLMVRTGCLQINTGVLLREAKWCDGNRGNRGVSHSVKGCCRYVLRLVWMGARRPPPDPDAKRPAGADRPCTAPPAQLLV